MSRVLRVFSFVAVLAFLAFAQGPSRGDSISKYDEFSKALSKSVSRDFSTEAVLIGVAFLVILVVLYEIYNSNKVRHKMLDLAWEKFNEHANHMRLSKGSVALLSKIAHKADLQDPYSIIKSAHVFENALESYYEKNGIFSMPSEMFSDIRELRRALGFLPLSKEISYTSTRQFCNGEKCLVQIPDTGAPSHKGSCTILSVGEKEWSITRPDGSVLIAPGTFTRINLTRPGDAEYSFKAEILRDMGDGLILSHSHKLNRTQQRNWVRVDVNIPVEVKKLEKGHVGDMLYGKIVDMSGGGFGINIPVRLQSGSILGITFELPGHGPITDLMVKVVRIAGTTHSVALEGREADISKVQEQITQYIFEKQRQDIIAKNKFEQQILSHF
ncbi:MAG: PilZ domain-containing protein [Fibromonadaceae bacterium]|jgi:c-di-GMP-binding flagellar brake protein YcgR|nr:PilZ domain-containing protein [Fibromonadaceae bacterium]